MPNKKFKSIRDYRFILGEVYISETRRCVTAPDIEYLQRSHREYDSTYDSQYNSYADNNDCDPGYEWASFDQKCYDIDECTRETHDCDVETQVSLENGRF